MPASFATIAYNVTAQGPTKPADLFTAVHGALLDVLDPVQMGLATVIVSDTTTGPVGAVVTRTIVYRLGVEFNQCFPDGTNQQAPFVNLLREQLSAKLACRVDAAVPIIT